MGFRFQLRDALGGDLGEAEYAYQPRVGDLIHVDGNRRMRVTAFIPAERIAEFVAGPIYGILEIEPVA